MYLLILVGYFRLVFSITVLVWIVVCGVLILGWLRFVWVICKLECWLLDCWVCLFVLVLLRFYCVWLFAVLVILVSACFVMCSLIVWFTYFDSLLYRFDLA